MATSDEELANYLHTHGFRVTPQRMLIIKYLQDNHTHPTADEIFEAVRVGRPTMSHATVYKTLNMLVEIGYLRELNFGGTHTRYDINLEDHINIYCESCGNVWDYNSDEISKLLDEMRNEIPGEIRSQRINVYQICKKCLKKQV
ncbi:MAG: transcriptional repressor [Candidatus Heimdallarchaeota archaeon]|nr:transcriptional repressor [Candidatus Heimdallarchaeota archaeon]